jgi:serine/threonine protein kinase
MEEEEEDEEFKAIVLIPTHQALDYIHNQGLIHRDVKAANIMIEYNKKKTRGTFIKTPCM